MIAMGFSTQGFESHLLRQLSLILLSYFEFYEPNPRINLDMAAKGLGEGYKGSQTAETASGHGRHPR